MKCPKCERTMKVDSKNDRYVCDNCGKIINWSEEYGKEQLHR